MKLNDYITRQRLKKAIFIIIFMLFITLLRKPDSSESGFLASFSLIEGRPVSSSQGGQFYDECISLNPIPDKAGGWSTASAVRPALLTTTPEKAGGSTPDNAHPPQLNDWLDEMIDKIHQVESGGQTDPPDGDDGRAVGALQIHKCTIDDVNRYYRTNFKYSDRSDFPKARTIARLYIQMWMETHREEIASKIWNGGPRGWQKKSTDAYWEKVKAAK